MVYVNPPFIECHASTILEVNENKFLITAFGGSKEGKNDVSIWLSENINKKWGNPKLMDTGESIDNFVYPCWNPVLFKSNKGDLSLFYKIGPSPREWWGMIKTSFDNGKNWSKGKKLPPNILGPIKNKPVQLKNGDILSPSSTETITNEGLSWKIHIEKSEDNGKTWEKIKINSNSKYDVIQPSILKLENNRLQILCRSRNNFIMQSFSEDGGNNWSKITKTNLPNPNSGTDAITLSNGYHVLVYNPKNNKKNGRSKLSIAFSKDGINWIKSLILEDEKKGEFSYPSIIESIDGKIHISYTYNRKNIKHVILEYDKTY
ncbi:MAG: exo-alpha-sialidase [Flavobacteriaceae bacterium]|nr:exo-alpha-sialidase [Flavobacteriaceae bacterium]